jgi:hypothetical protein
MTSEEIAEAARLINEWKAGLKAISDPNSSPEKT